MSEETEVTDPRIAVDEPQTLSDRTIDPAIIAPGAIMNVRPVGVLVMEDDGGQDEKIIAVPSSKLTQRYDRVANYTDLPEITIKQIEHFFEHYKDLEPGKWAKIIHWGDAEEARRLILEAVERAKAAK